MQILYQRIQTLIKHVPFKIFLMNYYCHNEFDKYNHNILPH